VLNVANAYVFWDPHVSKAFQHPSVNIIELGLHFLSAGALVIMATTVTNRKWLTWTTFALFLPGIYNALNALAGSSIPIVAPWWPLLTLLPAGYLCVMAMSSEYTAIKRVAAAGAIMLAVFIVFYENIHWVSGWLGLFATLGTVAFIKNKRVFFVSLVAICVLTSVAWPFLHTNVVEESERGGDYDRFSLTAGAVKYASTFPLGVGLGNYRTYNSFYYGEKWGTTSYTSAHGTYSQHLSETGFPGLLLFLWVLISGFVWMLRSYKTMKPGPSKMFVLAAVGQMIGIACAASIGDYIIPTYHNGGLGTFSSTVYSWLAWGLAVAHVRISRDEANGSLYLNS
jgi:hypothetical protein